MDLPVTTASTGQHALDLLSEHPLDAVVLNLGLPDRKGSAVLDWLRTRDGGPEWVLISELDRQDAQREYGPLGKHFLTKPFDPWELASLVRQLIPIVPDRSEMDGLKEEDDAR